MSATFHDQRLFHQPYGETTPHTQPQIVVLAGGQGFIEVSNEIEKAAVDNHGRRTYEASFKQQRKTVSAWLTVIFSGVDSLPVPHPDFVGLAEQHFGTIAQKFHLCAK